MKHIFLLLSFIPFLFYSCQEAEYVLFDDVARVQMDETAEIKVDFYYLDKSIVRDTAYLTIHTIGVPENRERKIALKQITEYDIEYQYDNKGNLVDSVVTEKANKAIPGIHYVPMDDPEMEKLLIVRPDSVSLEVPIIILRDTSLQREEFRLCLQLTETEDFFLGESEHLSGVIVITDKLSKPGFWDSWVDQYFLGTYSTRKHEFIYEITGEKIDDAWYERLTLDSGERTFWQNKFKNALNEYNSDPDNIAKGLAPMREDQNDPNSSLIMFP